MIIYTLTVPSIPHVKSALQLVSQPATRICAGTHERSTLVSREKHIFLRSAKPSKFVRCMKEIKLLMREQTMNSPEVSFSLPRQRNRPSVIVYVRSSRT